MTPPTERERRILAVAATCASEMNSDLCIMASLAAEWDEPELKAALQRCVWRSHGLEYYCGKRGGEAKTLSMDQQILEDKE